MCTLFVSKYTRYTQGTLNIHTRYTEGETLNPPDTNFNKTRIRICTLVFQETKAEVMYSSGEKTDQYSKSLSTSNGFNLTLVKEHK